MSRSAAALVCLALPAQAEAPKVVTDILPVQNLVAAVMGDIGTPTVIVQPGTSPHSANLRPSQARALDEADLVFWIGPNLTPWLDPSIDALSGRAEVTVLLDVPGISTLEPREEAVFELEDDDHDDHGHKDHDHDHDEHSDEKHADEHDAHGHDEHGHEEHADEHGDEHEDHGDEHDEAHDDHGHAHDHGDVDPHAWLDPEIAKVWTDLIAARLSAVDAENADTYAANANAAKIEIDAATAEVAEGFSDLKGVPFSFYHDAFQYFEVHFELSSVGALLSGDAEAASAGRRRALEEAMKEAGGVCVFSETQFPARLSEALKDDLNARFATIDPLGADIATGVLGYPTLLRNLGETMRSCLSASS